MQVEDPLRKEAAELGIKFANNISDLKLKERINEHKASLGNAEAKVNSPLSEIDNTPTTKKEPEEVIIERSSACGYYVVVIKGYEEAARRSNVAVEEVKEAITSGNAAGTYTFKLLD